ncbi:hypothetical protein RRG49_00010 [Mycoplasmopsis felis]|uniref:hypothetical protein n=1 Tax=Mycoplasmopsis felis TaxID=33923 RepID=UPI002AFFE288|nr:hypothetical protein [Mycoplasmopsis felis]WQQ09370.1 hypothetical protein RRG41_00235 [Mycoplasmopsis felis]
MNKKRLNLFKMLSLTIPVTGVISCVSCNETIKEVYKINEIKFTETNENESILKIKFNKEIINKDIKINFNSNLSYEIKKENNLVILAFNNLEENRIYEIKSIFIDNKELTKPLKLNYKFNKTPKLQKEVSVKDLNFSNITQNSANLNIKLENFVNNIELVINLNQNTYTYNLDRPETTINLNNLLEDTIYKINWIKINNIIVKVDNFQLTFQTLKTITNIDNKKENSITLQDIQINEISNNSASLLISFNEINQDQNTLLVELNNSLIFEKTFSVKNNFKLFINNLNPDTKYQITKLKLNNKEIELLKEYSFNTLSNPPENDFIRSYDIPNRNPIHKHYAESLNILDINETPIEINEVYKNFINNMNNDEVNEDLDIFKDQYKLNNYFINNNQINAYFSIYEDGEFVINYKIINPNNTITTHSKPLTKINQQYLFNLDNINDNIIIIDNITKNNSQLRYNGQKVLLFKKNKNQNSDNFKLLNNFDFYAYDEIENNNKILSFSSTIYLKDNSTNYPEIYWKYLDKNFHIQSTKLSGNNLTGLFKGTITNKDNYLTSLGLFFKEDNNYFYIDNQEQIKLLDDTKDNFKTAKNKYKLDLNRINIENNLIKISYSSNLFDNLNKVQLLIKSNNPFDRWSKLINTNINKNNNTLSFSQDLLPKHIKSFVITNSVINDKEINEYFLNKNNQFNVPKNINLKLNSFKVFKDKTNNQIFGSLDFNFNNENIEMFKNKFFELKFNVDYLSNEYEINFINNPVVYVKFNELSKFPLSNFLNNVKYTLNSIKVVEPYTLQDYVNNVFLNETNYYFVNNDVISKSNLNDLINQENSEFSSNNQGLITKKTNLNLDDLINIWLSDETKNLIPYSQENLSSVLKYNKLYKTFFSKTSNRPIKNFLLIDESDKTQIIKSFAPREILEKTVFNIENNKVSITKDLSDITNLEELSTNEIYLNFEFEFDLNFKKVRDYYKNNYSKYSFLNISIPYNAIKNQNQINNIDFDVYSDFMTYEQLQEQKNLISSLFSFNIRKNNNNLTLEIIPKEDIKFYDLIVEHNLSNTKSVFISNVLYSINYLSEDELIYTQKPLKNQESAGLNEQIINNNELTSQISQPINSTKRLYKENTDKVIKQYRSRAFTFKSNGGSWTVLGKVKPNDPSDYRFFVTTNDHVWETFANADEIQKFNNPWITKIDKQLDLKVPRVIDKNIATNDISSTIVSDYDTKWNNEVPYEFELINNFFNHADYPQLNIFKKNDLSIASGTSKLSDNVIAIVNFKFFFENFEINKPNSWKYKNQTLNQNEQEIVQFIHNLINLDLLNSSKLNRHLSNFINLNYYIAGFPAKQTSNEFSPVGDNKKRWREYLVGNSILDLHSTNYCHARFKCFQMDHPFITTNTQTVDISAGFSGSGLYDSQGNFAGHHVLGDLDEYGYSNKYAFILDNQEKTVLGNGNTPFNTSSFYERMRYLSYLYPERYQNQFNKTPSY